LTSLDVLQQFVKKNICFWDISQNFLTFNLGDHDEEVKFTDFCILTLSAIECCLYLIYLFQILLDFCFIGCHIAVDTVYFVFIRLFLSEIMRKLLINGFQSGQALSKFEKITLAEVDFDKKQIYFNLSSNSTIMDVDIVW